MHLDILIFAVIAAFLIYRLKAVLGTRHGNERPRQNPFAAKDAAARAPVAPKPELLKKPPLITDYAADKDGRIAAGLEEITAADHQFDVNSFMEGAKAAFETIVTAYSRSDRSALKPLLSSKLYNDFDDGIKAREGAGHISETMIHRIKAARIVEAHLGGTMAYITVDYDVEQTTVTRDKTGAVVEGNPDRISSVEDIWTFTRDIRSSDPNWILIETSAADK
ncbi:MAG: Tim44/TimA family putative adaptor protein [Alphaproteobacteria bacterium]|nr:Tim44/TimA family putative adaptor protein [Alphaproteobacteria bacterium]